MILPKFGCIPYIYGQMCYVVTSATIVISFFFTQGEVFNVACKFDQAIEFKNLYFAYNKEDWVLKNVNLKIEQGSTVAFVGATEADGLERERKY